MLASLLCSCLAAAEPVPAEGLEGKTLVGYQGWFRCPGDASDLGWVHWSRERGRIAPETLTFEMWPDLTDHGPDERFLAPGFSYPDGRPAELFTSDHPRTVLRHFEWMRDHGLDGAWLQHFVVDLPGSQFETSYPSRMRVLNHVRAAAAATGRVWALAYDFAAMPPERIAAVMAADWRRMVDSGVTADPRYLRQDGRPVVMIWCFMSERFGADIGRRILEIFRGEEKYRAFVIGGCQWWWREEPDPEWGKLFREFDGLCPWNVGNWLRDEAGEHAQMRTWADDLAECRRLGIVWLPVLYPGFGWDNLMRQPPGTTDVPRRGGKFYWEQFQRAAELGCRGAYLAMFDEVDEGTAIFKVTSSPPTQAHFDGYEGLPSDWYLRLAGAGRRLLRGELPLGEAIPIAP